MPFSANRVWAAIEDWLAPALRLTTHERAIYYHLLRRTFLDGCRATRISRRGLARATGLSTYTARQYLRTLARKRCVRIADHSPLGCLIEVRLPHEIRRHLPRLPRAAFLFSVELDAAGQPRAWPRPAYLSTAALRDRILRRERGRCFYCRRRLLGHTWTLDHVVPIARGGSDSPSNLVAACAPCNSEKGASTAAEFLRSLHRKRVLSRTQLATRFTALRALR